jgi:hypothetical protein
MYIPVSSDAMFAADLDAADPAPVDVGELV